MKPPPRPRRPPYWTLVALPFLFAFPFSWAMAGLGAVAVAQVLWGVTVTRRGGYRSGAGRQTPASGVNLGVSSRGRRVGLSDAQLSTHGLIVGASGAGKSTTLLQILGGQIRRGQPVVVLDLKGSPSFAGRLQAAAISAGRPFQLWTPDGPAHWNPLARGNPTELKDKLISTERFTEPHYQRAAERYLQITLQVMQASGREPGLGEVVDLLEPRRLAAAVRRLRSPQTERVQDYLGAMTADQLSAVRGLGTRLAILSESHAGRFLAPAERGPGNVPMGGTGGADIDLRAALDGPEVVLFSLNSSRYGKLAAQLGTLVIQDLVSATGERLQRGANDGVATVAVDEFSALGSDHVLQLLARGREAGVSVLLATQELVDLDRAAPGFRDQVLGLTALKIAHRQDVPGSAQTIAQMAGTEQYWEDTVALRSLFSGASGNRGTRRLAERFVVHPNEIKTLGPGQAVVLTKTPKAGVTRVRVAGPDAGGREGPGGPAGRNRTGGPGRLPPGDQAEPGVTR